MRGYFLTAILFCVLGHDCLASGIVPEVCKSGDSRDIMVKVGAWCVDKYDDVICDASKSGKNFDESCISDTNGNNGPHSAEPDESKNTLPTVIAHDGTIIDANYHAYSRPGYYATRFVNYYQALAACANSGKQLLSDSMWVTAALGTFDPGDNDGTVPGNTKCNTNSSWIRPNGAAGNIPGGDESCISQWGVEDLIGNYYQWTDVPTDIRADLSGKVAMNTLRIGWVPKGQNSLEGGRGFVGFRCMKPYAK